MIMLTADMIDDLMSVDIRSVDRGTLSDISTLTLDNTLDKEERLDYLYEKLGNPFCFRCGEMGIKLEFDDKAPAMQEVLTNLLVHKKTGL